MAWIFLEWAWLSGSARGAGLLGARPSFMNSYREGRLVLASGTEKGFLYLLQKGMGTISIIDPVSGRSSIFLSGLSKPQNLAVGRDGHRMLVDLDASRTLLVFPLKGAGPPSSFSVGLNPGPIIRASDNRYYLAARAVHILYVLDPDRYRPTDWMAVGDVFREVSPDRNNNLWLPLYRSGQVMEVRTSPFAPVKTYQVEDCDHPVRVIPLPDGSFLAGCRNAIVLMSPNEEIRRFSIPGKDRHGLRDMILFPDGTHLLAIFHNEKTIFILDSKDLEILSRYRLPYDPVRLFSFRNWPILFVVMNDPGHERTWLSGFPLAGPSPVSGKAGSVPITSLPRKKM